MKHIVLVAFAAVALFAEIANLEGLKYADLDIKKDARCPVKNVPLKEQKRFVGVIQYNNGKKDVLSSPKYTFQYLLEKGKKNHSGIYKVYVTDFNTKRFIDAGGAHYVFGSTMMTIGGDDVISFRLKKDAQTFKEQYSGTKIFGYDRMDKKFLNYLNDAY